jgi:hypothetical protein
MSTTSVTPDQTQDAPPAPSIPQADPAALQQVATGGVVQPTLAPQGGSRLARIVAAVAKVASTAAQGIPDKGRSSFVTGLGEGARAAQAIKFKSFDDQVRLAQLHNQDIKLQNDTQEQTDAHKKADLENRALANSLGIDYDTIPSDGKAVMDHLTAQTASSGAASVPPGTHLSGDGETVIIPKDTQATRDGQKQMYSMLGPALGLPSLPPGAQFVPPNLMNMLTNKLHGYDIKGAPINHQDLPGAIGALQAQRDQLAKNGASPEQLKAVDNTLAIYKANLDALDAHAAGIKAKQKQAELDVANSPENQAAAARGAAQNKQAELDVINSPKNQAAQVSLAGKKSAAETEAKNKAGGQMFSGTDKDGNVVAGTSDELAQAGVANLTKLDADDQKKVIIARQLISPDGLFAQIHQDMLNLKAKGKLGSSMTARLNDALLNKAGADPDYAPLSVHTHLLATALMQAHVGSRGSGDMMEEFKNLAASGKMNMDTLRSALGAEYNYVHEKAMLPKKAKQ